MNQNGNNPNNTPPKLRKPRFLIYIVVLALTAGIWFFSSDLLASSQTTELNSTQFNDYFENNQIQSMYSEPIANNANHFMITGKYTVDGEVKQYKVVLILSELNEYIELTKTLYPDVKYETGTLESVQFWEILLSLIPYALIFLVFFFLIRGNASGNNKAFEFGKNRAKLMREKTKTFNDVAGCDEEKMELAEIVDFLKNPKKYTRLGARIPKGVLLVGPPGTGKTLLAKAVAGEANVPFYSISGSDFVEMFVGVGASRVRDLFKVAKENAPCIIFIDEIDAVGRQRGAGMGGGHDEREQTLNQLLVEMDGFSNNSGIIKIAATNRPDVLAPALLRPGRFDRQITINTPDLNGRVAILKVHARGKTINPSVDLEEVAHRIPGFSGADIENLLNEAALLVARDNRDEITVQDIDEAIDRVMMGPAKRNKTISPKEKKLVAYHEAGHAVIGLKLKDASIVQKVTIIPRGQFGGYNLFTPKEEKYNPTKTELIEQITGLLGGRVAEEIIFNEITTGAYNDIQRATKIARAMVAEYGMSDLGPIQYEQQSGNVFLGRDYLKEKNFSDVVAHEIDGEVRKIIFQCHSNAMQVINENMELLTNIAEYLIKVETLTKSDIDEIATTGKLAWYEEKMAQKAQEEAASKQVIEENATVENPTEE